MKQRTSLILVQASIESHRSGFPLPKMYKYDCHNIRRPNSRVVAFGAKELPAHLYFINCI
jgi:hypothetical protein